MISSPTVAGEVVCVGSNDHSLYAFDHALISLGGSS
ncbi:MAG: PQQ-binding-like beta-propeller repeat protein [Ktedonobacteraceae bacterium]